MDVDKWIDVSPEDHAQSKTPFKRNKRVQQRPPVKYTPGSTPKKKKAKKQVVTLSNALLQRFNFCSGTIGYF